MTTKTAKAPKATAAEKAIFAAIAAKPRFWTKDGLATEFGPKFGGREAVAKAWAALKARKAATTLRVAGKTKNAMGRYILTPVKA